MKQVCFLTLCLFFSLKITGQFNLKIGYTTDYLTNSRSNSIFENHLKLNPWLENDFKKFNFSRGLQLGFRFKQDVLAIDGYWERLKNSVDAFGTNLEQQYISNELEYVFDRFGIGLEFHGKYLGIGTNVNYETTKIKEISGGRDSKISIVNESNFGNKIYLIISTKGSKATSVSLQPYIQIPWKKIRLDDLHYFLNLPTPLDGNFSQKNYHLGISIFFYNGPQNN